MIAIAKRNDIAPAFIELEITERILMKTNEDMLQSLDRLSQLGFGFSIDDFGTGYSNLGYIAKFPIDKIKIDISFVRNIHMKPKNIGIVKAIIDLAHALEIETVAEGVEIAEEEAILESMGCDQIQGFYYSRPLRPEALLRSPHMQRDGLSGSPETR